MSGRALLAIVLLVVFCIGLPGCTKSDGGIKVERELLQAFVDCGVVSAFALTTVAVKLNKPFIPEGTVDLAEVPTGSFAPVAGTFPQHMGGGIEVVIQIAVTPPALPAGSSWNGTMRLTFTQASGGVSDEMELNLTASSEVPTLKLKDVPEFGKAAIGETISGKLSIENPNAVTPVELTGLTGLSGDYSLGPSFPGFPITISPGSTLGISVHFTPSSVGLSNVDISITNSLGVPINARIRGEGMQGEVVLLDWYFPPLDAAGESDWIEIDVPPEAISIAFVASDLAGGLIDITQMEGPSGQVYTDDFSGPWIWWRGIPNGYVGWLSCQLPNSDSEDTKLDWRGGTYRFKVMCWTPLNPRVGVHVTIEQRWAGYASKGTLPVNVYIADGIPLTAADAPADSRMHSVLGTCDALLGQIGMRLGNITYHKLGWPGWDTIDLVLFEDLVNWGPYATDPSDPDFPPTLGKLHLYFVKDFSGALTGILGAASAIPGFKVDQQPAPYTGVVMAYEGWSAFTVGSTVAHEAGHFLGLLHPVEKDGLRFDIIEDTLECPAYGTNAICTEEGANYLMHWMDLGPEGRFLTPGQRRVMLRQVHVEPGLPDPPWIGGTITGLAGIDIPVQFAEAAVGLPMRRCANCKGLLPLQRR
jgi:hypothetical protein